LNRALKCKATPINIDIFTSLLFLVTFHGQKYTCSEYWSKAPDFLIKDCDPSIHLRHAITQFPEQCFFFLALYQVSSKGGKNDTFWRFSANKNLKMHLEPPPGATYIPKHPSKTPPSQKKGGYYLSFQSHLSF
jgi:hypothetical protein